MKTKILSFLLLCLFMTGCSDFLDTEQRGVIPQEDFYKTDADALAAVYAIYDSLQDGEPFLFKNFISDESNVGGGARGDNFGYEEMNEFTHGPSNPKIELAFQTYYKSIYLCNLAIDKLASDTETKVNVKADAKAIRAYNYFELVTMWGRVPLVLHELATNEYAQPNSEVDAIWARIETDLLEAIPDLPLKSQQNQRDKARMSKGAAQALLGKAYLYQKKYAEAAVQFEAVISSGEYALYGDFSKILREEHEFGIESLFEISEKTDVSQTSEGEHDFYACGPRAGFFTAGDLAMEAGWGFMPAKGALYQAFVDAGDDVRRKATILNEEEMAVYGTSVKSSDGVYQYGGEGYLRMKYATWTGERGPSATIYYGTNVRVIRYADVLLMAAEAYNRSGNDTRALECINQVRSRVELPILTSGGEQLFEDIKLERRLELAYEHVRYQDLIRWGDAAKVFANQGKRVPRGDGSYFEIPDAGFKERNWLFPIPEAEMNVNQLIEQNPGW